MGKHTERAAAMRRHPAGKRMNHNGITVPYLRLVSFESTAIAAETPIQEGNAQ